MAAAATRSISLLVPIAFTALLLSELGTNRDPFRDLLERADALNASRQHHTTDAADLATHTRSCFISALEDARVREADAATSAKLWYVLAVLAWVTVGFGPYRALSVEPGEKTNPVMTTVRLQKQA